MHIFKFSCIVLSLLLLAGCGSKEAPATTTVAAPTEPRNTPRETTSPKATTEPSAQWPEPGKIIALTFDDGPSRGTMVQVLDLLKEYDAKATFFIIGSKINETTMPVMERAIAEGHELGNHSMNHVPMAELTEEEILSEYNECQQLMIDTFGIDMHFFRAPYGSIDDRMYSLIQAPFMGGISTGDGTIGSIAADRAWKATSGAYDGAIIVMHCFQGNDETVKALEIVLPELKAQGYKFVTLTELYNLAGYEVPGPTPGIKIKDNKPQE